MDANQDSQVLLKEASDLLNLVELIWSAKTGEPGISSLFPAGLGVALKETRRRIDLVLSTPAQPAVMSVAAVSPGAQTRGLASRITRLPAEPATIDKTAPIERIPNDRLVNERGIVRDVDPARMVATTEDSRNQ